MRPSIDAGSQWVASRAPQSLPWPGERQLLLLQAALGDRDTAESAARLWAGSADLDRIDFGSYRLLPLVARNLERHGVDPPFQERIRGIYRRAWYRNQVLINAAAGAIGALDEAGIPVMVLKGASTLQAHYPDLGSRPMADIDLLVPRPLADEAITSLESAGWEGRAGLPRSEVNHGARFVDRGHGEVDLHWATASDVHPRFGEEGVWERSVADPVVAPARRPSPEDELLMAIRHGLRHGRVVSWVADAVLVIRSGALDWSLLTELVADYDCAYLAGRSLELLREIDPLLVPADVVARIGSMPHRRWHRREFRVVTSGWRSARLDQIRRTWYRFRRWRASGGQRANPLRFPGFWRDMQGLTGPFALTRHALGIVADAIKGSFRRGMK